MFSLGYEMEDLQRKIAITESKHLDVLIAEGEEIQESIDEVVLDKEKPK